MIDKDLEKAVVENDLKAVLAALERGADPVAKNSKGQTAYDLAIDLGYSEVAEALLPVTYVVEPSFSQVDLNEAMDTLFGGSASSLLTKVLASSKMIKRSTDKQPVTKQSSASQKKSYVQNLPKEEPEKKELLKLEDFVGQEKAKRALENIIAVAKLSVAREKKGLPALSLNFHAVFQGNPGTGKTTFARFYAQEIKRLGLLAKGHLIEVGRQDLIAEYQGQTSSKTAAVIEKARGGVLFIDEAYALKHSKNDNYGQECIDTLVKGIEDFRSELIVILAGYTDEMRAFLHLNPGLKSRIPNIIEFADFSNEELLAIFKLMMGKQKMTIEEKAAELFIEEISLARKGKSFGNAREARNLLERALTQQSHRLSQKDLNKLTVEELSMLIYSDLTEDPEDSGTYEELAGKDQSEATAMQKLMRLHGLAEVKRELRQLSDYISVTKARRGSASLGQLTNHMIFMGNPGTGKTTVARLMGEIFREIGLLASGHLIEVDRSGLVGGYQGQTAIKTREVIESAIAGVLFIDEAYTLARAKGQDSYGQEAIDTLLKFMEDLRGQFVVILAGYSEEMELFLNSNTGLRSRFSKVFEFSDFNETELEAIASDMLKEQGFLIEDPAKKILIDSLVEEKKRDGRFANARSLRQKLEAAYKNHAARIVKLGHPDSMDSDILNTLTAEDFS